MRSHDDWKTYDRKFDDEQEQPTEYGPIWPGEEIMSEFKMSDKDRGWLLRTADELDAGADQFKGIKSLAFAVDEHRPLEVGDERELADFEGSATPCACAIGMIAAQRAFIIPHQDGAYRIVEEGAPRWFMTSWIYRLNDQGISPRRIAWLMRYAAIHNDIGVATDFVTAMTLLRSRLGAGFWRAPEGLKF